MKDSAWLYSETGHFHTNVYTVSVVNTNYDPKAIKEAALARVDEMIAMAESPAEVESRRKLRQHLVEAMPDAPVPSRSGPGISEATGMVHGNSYPDSGFGNHSALIWLAYCSHDFLRAQTHNPLPYVWKQYPGLNKPEDVIQSKALISDARPNLPTKVDFYNKGVGFALRGSNTVLEPLLPPYQNGYTNAVYEALTWTNINGLKIPKTFKLTVWAPKAGAHVASDLRMVFHAFVETTSIRVPCRKTDFVPMLPVTTRIVDQRSSLHYTAQAGHWPMTTNENEMRSYDRAVLNRHAAETKEN